MMKGAKNALPATGGKGNGYIPYPRYLANSRVNAMSGGRTHFKATFLVALFLVSGMFGFMLNPLPVVEEAEAAPNPIPVLTLGLFPTNLQAKVTQSQLGSVTFGGNATVDKIQGIERVTVTIQAVVNTGWPVVVSPQTMVFVNPRTQQFQVNVIVPPATSSLLTGNVIVSGQAKAPGLAPVVAAASGVVTVSQYFKLRIEAEQPLRQVKPGELTYNVVNVYNDGNGQDTFELEIENNEDLVKKQFTVLLGSTDITVQQDEYQPVRVTVQTPQQWTLYKKEMNTFILKVTSSEARAKNLLYTKTYPLYIYMKGYYIPGFDPFLAVMALAFIAVIVKRRQDLGDESLGRSF
jgi:hypothetical protein